MPAIRTLRLACVVALVSTSWAHAGDDDLASRVQVFFDDDTRTVVRQTVRLLDPDAGLALDFRWDPAAANSRSLDAEGRAEGPGRVVWRLPGLSAHDPRAWHHVYDGTLRAGRFHGDGVLLWRDGREMAGQFANGLLQGEGRVRDADGNVVEGGFVQGVLQGEGVYRARDGWVWRGSFRGGLMDGPGQMTEAGGRTYPMPMRQGVAEAPVPTDLAAHPLVGGMRPAQGGPSMADRTQISVHVDQRISANQWAPYRDRIDGDEVLIHPANDSMIDIWNGAADGEASFELQSSLPDDWMQSRALTVLDIATNDGARVRIEEFKLNVQASVPHLTPFLIESSHIGCRPVQPSFQVENHGWGVVENPQLKVRFVHPDDLDWENPGLTPGGTQWLDVPLAGFDDGSDVDLRPALDALGVDLGRLETARFTCPGEAMMDQCMRQATQSGAFGQLAALVTSSAYQKLIKTTLLGELTYEWQDGFGDRQTGSRQINVNVSLGLMTIPGGGAECGDGGPWPTEARRFLDVQLPYDAQDYSVDLPIRGNPNLSSLGYGVKFWSERSSIHVMQAEARFSDGSSRFSAKTILYFLNPRFPQFKSALKPAICTLTADDAGGSC